MAEELLSVRGVTVRTSPNDVAGSPEGMRPKQSVGMQLDRMPCTESNPQVNHARENVKRRKPSFNRVYFLSFSLWHRYGIVKPGLPNDSNEIRRWLSWPSTFASH